MSEEKKEAGSKANKKGGDLTEAEIKSLSKRSWVKFVICVVAIVAFILIGLGLIKFIGESIGEGLKVAMEWYVQHLTQQGKA